ncbi:M23 family metallopeptidase [Aestuariicella hydrocarbonica]|uniref:M23 family metallopeptidase n=2 Tax=Pseudomaricurvus hydrocarbonicus TaxID=1470433 RepID=A0A9E5MM57_9GAMM|nr:M23 family metallopeptidase [Aestuariicella hydrocarbonica]
MLSRLMSVLFLLGSGTSAVAVADIARPSVDSDWQQGAVLRGQLAKGEKLYFLEREVPVSEDGHFVLGLGRDFPETARLKVVDETGQSVVFTYPVKQRKYNIQKVEGVPARTVNPDPKDLQRIRRESAQTAAARKVISERQDFRQSFQWPLLGRISGVYGSQRYYNGEPRRPHFGVDVARPTGTPVAAPVDGIVRLAHKDMFYSGGTLILDHGQGLSSTFLHLSKVLVEEGQEVKQGELIAEVGATGRATGPHLDWRMNWFDQRVDPQLLVPPMSEAESQAKTAGQ